MENGVDINDFHSLLGHPNFVTTKRTAYKYHIKLSGIEKKCQFCDIAKIKTSNLNKVNDHKSRTIGECIYTDISSVKYSSYCGHEYWILAEDEYTKMKWSIFLKKKLR